MGIPDHLTCLLRYLYAGQEATVRTGHETTDWFQIGKGVRQGCILSSCLFNICRAHNHAKHWAGGSTSWNQDCQRNINNLRYADDTTLMEKSEEEVKSFLMKVKEESEKADLKLNIQNTKIKKKKNKDHSIQSHHFMVNRWGKSDRLYFLGLQNHCRW